VYRHPEIPSSLRNIRTHGGVLVYSVVIGSSGAISDVQLAKPVDGGEPWPSLERLWREAILEWRYEPSVVDGKPVAVCLTASVTIDVM
jgi:outer membrane biosynthesis protein TonB